MAAGEIRRAGALTSRSAVAVREGSEIARPAPLLTAISWLGGTEERTFTREAPPGPQKIARSRSTVSLSKASRTAELGLRMGGFERGIAVSGALGPPSSWKARRAALLRHRLRPRVVWAVDVTFADGDAGAR